MIWERRKESDDDAHYNCFPSRVSGLLFHRAEIFVVSFPTSSVKIELFFSWHVRLYVKLILQCCFKETA